MSNMETTVKNTEKIRVPHTKQQAARRTKCVSTIVCVLYAILLMVPFYVILVTSFTSYPELMSTMEFIWWPKNFTFETYKEIFTNGAFEMLMTGFGNTLWMTMITSLSSLFFSGLAAYAYSKLKFKGREAIFMIELATMMIPTTTLTLPSYLFYDALGWSHGFLPLVIPGMFGTATTIFFLRGYMSGIPNEILEAAKIDGLGTFGVYVKILLPQAFPAFIAQFIFMFVGSYNNYMGPLMYLFDDASKYTLQLALSEIQMMYADPNQICVSVIIALVPLIVLFIIFQKFFISGLTVGGGKES